MFAPANNGEQLAQHLACSRDSMNKKAEGHGQRGEPGIPYPQVPTSAGDSSSRRQTH